VIGAQTISLGVVADLGQTANSTETLESLYHLGVTQNDIDGILFGGDLSYADGDISLALFVT